MTFGRDGSDQRSGSQQHHDHGDDAGRNAGAVTVTVTVNGQNGNLTNGFSYIASPTVSSVSSEQRVDAGRDGSDDHGNELCRGSDGTFGRTAATNVVVVNSTTITATTPAGSAGAVTRNGDGERPERKPDERVHLRGDADGDQRIAE